MSVYPTSLAPLLPFAYEATCADTSRSELFCHPEYASYSPHPFAVNMDAPERGVVIPTLIYRALFRSWSAPITSPVSSVLSWTWATSRGLATSASKAAYEFGSQSRPAMAAHSQETWKVQEEVREEDGWDWSMAEDEVLRR